MNKTLTDNFRHAKSACIPVIPRENGNAHLQRAHVFGNKHTYFVQDHFNLARNFSLFFKKSPCC